MTPFLIMFNPFRVICNGDFVIATDVERLWRSEPGIVTEYNPNPEGVIIGR